MFQLLINPEQLKKLRSTNNDSVVFDCRHDLADSNFGKNQYALGHIPGAYFAHLDEDLSGAKTGKNGRHPLPDQAIFLSWLAEHGVSDKSQIVCYDDTGGMFAARLWWMCRWVGIESVAVLDGGWTAWLDAGGDSKNDVSAKRSAVLTLRPSLVSVINTEQVQENLTHPRFKLMDARAPERFSGQQDPIDPVAGHIPGAINHFFKLNLQDNGRFKSRAQLREQFQALLSNNTSPNFVMSCGSGVTACHNILAFELAGLGNAPLYAGSWSEWCSNSDRPTETGS